MRLAKELHDSIGQTLQLLKLKVDTIGSHHAEMSDRIQDLSALILNSISELRNLIDDLSPDTLEHLGLESAIRDLVRSYESNTGIGIQFQLWLNLRNGRFPPAVELGLYRIIQESVNNIIKHARAGTVTIQLTQLEGELLLMIEDDGVGFALDDKREEGNGLRNMAERCRVLGAELEVDTQPGAGCTINIRVPLANTYA
jgi:signal transduction histidine kinase